MTQYHVVQYIPDIVLNERINIGIIIYDDETILVGETSNWERISFFNYGEVDTDLLRGILEDFKCRDNIKRAQRWINCLQVSCSRGSILPLGELFNDLCERFKMVPL